MSTVERPEQAGDQLGAYVLEKQLGEGSMGRVWLAQHVTLGRKAAIKVLKLEHAHNTVVVNRFFDEARAVNRINHDHIVEILDFVHELQPDRVYCVMEYLEGSSLAQATENGPLPIQAILTIAKQVCEALDAAHRVGVIHRDVKPDNIFIARRPGEPLFVKVLDFGVAKLGEDLRRVPVSKTVAGTLIGTPLFMSPEAIVGQEVDARADVYAVGCVLYWLLAGRLPFNSTDFGQLSMSVIQEPPAGLPTHTSLGERVPSGLAALTMACLAKKREHRPPSMKALAAALDRPGQVPLAKKRLASRSTFAAVAVAIVAAVTWVATRTREPVRMAESTGTPDLTGLIGNDVRTDEPTPTAIAVPDAAQPRPRASMKRLHKVPIDDATIDPFAP